MQNIEKKCVWNHMKSSQQFLDTPAHVSFVKKFIGTTYFHLLFFSVDFELWKIADGSSWSYIVLCRICWISLKGGSLLLESYKGLELPGFLQNHTDLKKKQEVVMVVAVLQSAPW